MVLFAIASWLITYTDAYKRIPRAVWDTKQISTIGAMAELTDPRQRAMLDSLMRESSGAASAAPKPVKDAASKWGVAVNEQNPDALLYLDADSFGNLYVVPGAWWEEASDEHRIMVTYTLGEAWQLYFKKEFPQIRGWDPGFFVVAETGRVAQYVNGQVELLRPAAGDTAGNATAK